MKFSQVAVAGMAASTVSAWSWPAAADFSAQPYLDTFLGRRQYAAADDLSLPILAPRQDSSSQQSSASSAAQSSSAPSISGLPTVTLGSGSSQTTNSNSGSQSITSNSGSQSGGSSSTAAQNTSTIEVNPQDPLGGISMLVPAATAGVPYYKVGDTVTWQWNYTSLEVTPTAIDILATVTQSGGSNPSPFTLAVNQSIDATQTFLWDTGKYASETSGLPIGTYTLIIYDSSETGGVSAVPSAGHLAPYHQWTFGMYTPRVDEQSTGTSLAYVCATCNSASGLERMTVGGVVTIAALTVSSFMWFAGGWGAFI